jgi:hypothetical protein
MDRSGGRLVLRYAARDPATEGRARRSVVVVVRFAFMRQRVATQRAECQRARGAVVEDPELNPGGDAPEDDRNEEVEGSPVPDPTEDDGDADDVPGAD